MQRELFVKNGLPHWRDTWCLNYSRRRAIPESVEAPPYEVIMLPLCNTRSRQAWAMRIIAEDGNAKPDPVEPSAMRESSVNYPSVGGKSRTGGACLRRPLA